MPSLVSKMYNRARFRTAARRITKVFRSNAVARIRARRLSAFNVRNRALRSYINKRRYPSQLKPKTRSLRF